MKSTLTALFFLTGLALAAPAPAQQAPAASKLAPSAPSATAEVKGAGGKAVGTATLANAPDGVLIRIELAAGALSPGWHGIHLHEKGDCADAAFENSGGHIGHGMGGKEHGLLNPNGPEFGDLPNIYAASATAPTRAELFTTLVTLGAAPVAGRAPLQDTDGTAIVIHTNADDQMTQPIGGAGDRVACAVVK